KDACFNWNTTLFRNLSYFGKYIHMLSTSSSNFLIIASIQGCLDVLLAGFKNCFVVLLVFSYFFLFFNTLSHSCLSLCSSFLFLIWLFRLSLFSVFYYIS